MRMWNVNPKLMCTQHLLGEHLEMHMFVGTILKGISLKGYLRNGLVEIHNIKNRHKELVEEMTIRGMKHKSELPFFISAIEIGKVDTQNNIKILSERCTECQKRIKEFQSITL